MGRALAQGDRRHGGHSFYSMFTYSFGVFGFANLLIALVGAGVTVHLFEVPVGTGLSRAVVGEMLVAQGVAGIAGKLVTGWLLDRFQAAGCRFPVLRCRQWPTRCCCMLRIRCCWRR